MKPIEARQLEARSRARVNGVRVREVLRGNQYSTASQSQPDTVYELKRTRAGWTCSCPGFTYSGSCKHIGQVERRSEREGWEFGRIAPRTR